MRPAADPADAVPALAAEAVTGLGDVWLLRNHRVLCGDACDAASYRQLLPTSGVQLVFTDPPFNLRIQGHVSTLKSHREFAMASGEVMPPEFVAFLHLRS